MISTYGTGGINGGNQWVDVDPYTGTSTGNCYSQTFTATYGAFSISSAQQICPQRIFPRFLYARGYGVGWEGLSVAWRGAHGVGVVSSPPQPLLAAPSVPT